MLNLYSIPAEWQAILETLENDCGEITPETEARAQALIEASKDKIEAAALAKRNLELRAEQAQAQAKVFQAEAAQCSAQAEVWTNAAKRLGELILPALKITGNVQTPAGTIYPRTNTRYEFTLKAGFNFFDLPDCLYRQRDPELNLIELKTLAKNQTLPEAILATECSTTAVCFKRAVAKGE
jgi:hypothetical protein